MKETEIERSLRHRRDFGTEYKKGIHRAETFKLTCSVYPRPCFAPPQQRMD
jgi:hypothetical protein